MGAGQVRSGCCRAVACGARGVPFAQKSGGHHPFGSPEADYGTAAPDRPGTGAVMRRNGFVFSTVLLALWVPVASGYIRSTFAFTDGSVFPQARKDNAGIQFYLNN